jgi:hypothetical protein
MSFAKAIPLLGDIWSNYYVPMTNAILNKLEDIALLRDKDIREIAGLNFALDKMDTSRLPHEAPTIPKDVKSAFPGGQPVFDFMYGIMKGAPMMASSDAREYFAKRRDLFNAPHSDEDNHLETYGANVLEHVIGSHDNTVNLEEWATKNKETVWAQLYGSLDYMAI